MEERILALLQALYARLTKGVTDPFREPWPTSPEQLREEVNRYE